MGIWDHRLCTPIGASPRSGELLLHIPREGPVQLSAELDKWSWSVPYAAYAGEVVAAKPRDWERLNGFSNKYAGSQGKTELKFQRKY